MDVVRGAPYTEGIQAAIDGEPESACPYTMRGNLPHFASWRNGYYNQKDILRRHRTESKPKKMATVTCRAVVRDYLKFAGPSSYMTIARATGCKYASVKSLLHNFPGEFYIHSMVSGRNIIGHIERKNNDK